jgi:hypothetical protein
VDATGDVIAAGVTTPTVGPGISAFTVVKLDKSSGAEDWRRVITDSPSPAGRANAVVVDAVGDVIAGGVIPTAGSRGGFAVVKLDSASGGERWRYSAAAAPGFADGVSKMAVDAAGNVVAVGRVTNTYPQADFAVIKVNGASGVELWRQTLNGTANGPDGANAVAVDAAGDVFAAGFLENTTTGSDFTVVKFDGRTGAERWRQVLPAPSGCCVGGAQTVDVDDAGDVVVAGWTLNPGASPDYFTIIKFDGFNGVERWRRIISTPSGCCLSGVSAVYAAGDVIAAGGIQDNIGSHYTVVKLRGSDGGDFGTNACRGEGSFRLRGRARVKSWKSDDPEVTLTLTGPAGCRETIVANSAGAFMFRNLGTGPYTLTAAGAGCSFVPESQTVTLEQRISRANFDGTCPNERPRPRHDSPSHVAAPKGEVAVRETRQKSS